MKTFKAFTKPQVITMLFLGISAGIPILLIFSSLSLWLREAGVERSAVTFFSWAALGYSFKFVWAPLIDKIPVPLLTKFLGRRRAWILVSQASIITAICWMAFTNPVDQNSLTIMAIAATFLGFSSATQDIVIDAYRIESGSKNLQALMSATYIAGYRIGMLIAGAGALFLADIFGSSKEVYQYHAWMNSYLVIAGTMFIGVITTLLMSEPKNINVSQSNNKKDYFSFFMLFLTAVLVFILTYIFSSEFVNNLKTDLNPISQFLINFIRFLVAITLSFSITKLFIILNFINKEMFFSTYINPVKEFVNRYPLKVTFMILAIIGLYRISDIVLGVISNVFYQDLGFSKTQIAAVVKVFGPFMTIAGGFLGGIIALKMGVIKTLMIGAVLTILTNLMFVLLAYSGSNLTILYLVISADNLTAGLASAGFVAFLSALTNIKFTAMQYAIFSSMMTLIPKVLGGFSGTIVDSVGYVNFFIFASLIGLPVLLLVFLVKKNVSL